MKSMKKLQVAVAVTALFAVTGSMAASVNQSGVTIAREVIASNTTTAQTIKAPSLSFNFDNGPTANALGNQDFSVTLKLGGDGAPTWGSNVPTYKTISAVRRNNGNTIVPVTAANHVEGNAAVFIRLLGVDDVDTTTKRFRFRLENQSAGSVSLGDLQLAFNSVNGGQGSAAPYILTPNVGTFAAGAAANALLTTPPIAAEFNNIGTLAASANANPLTTGTSAGETGYYNSADTANSCGEPIRRVTVLARNFIGSGGGVEGESSGANLSSITNNGYIVFGTALGVKVDIGAAKGRATDPTSNNNLLTIPTGSGVTNSVMALGRVTFTNIPNFQAQDTSTTGNFYSLAPTVGARTTNEFTSGINNVGDVDVASAGAALSVAITSTNGFATGTTFALSNTPSCSVTGGTIVTTGFGVPALSGTANTIATATFTSAQLAALVGAATVADSLVSPTTGTYAALYGTAPTPGNNGFYLCMQTPGTTQIPQSSFTAVARLLKDDSTEQANFSCPGTLAGLGGGVKIDVRNFFPYQSDSQEWISVLRVINNSETTDADLTGQYIRADGKYGRYGSMGTLPARGAQYFTSKQVDAALNMNSSAAGADNTSAGGTTAAAGSVAPNTRVRVSSNAASTLRVQNYMFNTRTLQLVEVSASQGADFVNLGSSLRDHIDQDAQTGIQK